MAQLVLLIHLLLAVVLVIVILLQRSEGGALGIGGGGGSGLFSARGKSDFLTKTTAVLATAFIITSLILTVLSSRAARQDSIVERIQIQEREQSQEPPSAVPFGGEEGETLPPAPPEAPPFEPLPAPDRGLPVPGDNPSVPLAP